MSFVQAQPLCLNRVLILHSTTDKVVVAIVSRALHVDVWRWVYVTFFVSYVGGPPDVGRFVLRRVCGQQLKISIKNQLVIPMFRNHLLMPQTIHFKMHFHGCKMEGKLFSYFISIWNTSV
jgi:hypothetical protein